MRFCKTEVIDGQSGRGDYGQMGKKVNDNRCYNGEVVPLSLCRKSDGEVIWFNPEPAGDTFMWPWLMTFEKENEEMILRITKDHEEDIANLKLFKVNIGKKVVYIEYKVYNTMHDLKEVVALIKNVLRQCFFIFILDVWGIPCPSF